MNILCYNIYRKKEERQTKMKNLTPNKLRILAKIMENPEGVKLREIVEMNGKWEANNIDEAFELALDGYVAIEEGGVFKIKED